MDIVTKRLRDSLQAVEDAAIPPELRAAAFGLAFHALATIDNSSSNSLPIGAFERATAPATSPLQSRGKQYGIEAEALLEIFTESEGELSLTIPLNRLPSEKKARVQTLALVTAFLRQGAGLEDFTAQDVISAIADEYGCRDSNFSTYMKAMGEHFQIKTDSGKRFFRLRRSGWEKAAEEVSRLAS
ncbi:MAG: recombination protein O N-terminal domain-containing protein [Thermomicrobiales bacterium]|nr:recombination protein O N-terminal domain-containing protein [Thermomicrobiales bacterium]MCO5227151.1 recombination protein O N-terminal domain-containing protein [Thermomicrobiales bacterium]